MAGLAAKACQGPPKPVPKAVLADKACQGPPKPVPEAVLAAKACQGPPKPVPKAVLAAKACQGPPRSWPGLSGGAERLPWPLSVGSRNNFYRLLQLDSEIKETAEMTCYIQFKVIQY
jgi:hypothetical protein